MKTKSQGDVRAFLKQIRKDEKLRNQLQFIKSTNKQQWLPEIVRIANAAGYTFTAEQYEAAAREQLAAKGHGACEISEEELVSFASGCC
jgi:predicted ribosomally synthesized peptide with nif11-like leader